MRFKLDENMPCDRLAAFAFADGMETVEQEGLSGRNDLAVWEASQREGRFLITQDLDFSDLRRFLPGTHHGILLLRLRTPSRRNINQRLEEILKFEDVESWKGCFVVATDSKIRVRRPGG